MGIKMSDNLVNNLKKRLFLVSLIPAVVFGVLALNYYYQFESLKDNPQKVSAKENRELVAAISKLIVLPEGEEPTIAVVTDLEPLKDQPFFAKAKRGDRVLIYTNNRKAILYRPDENKIVEVAPINIGNPIDQEANVEEEELEEEEEE